MNEEKAEDENKMSEDLQMHEDWGLRSGCRINIVIQSLGTIVISILLISWRD